MVNFCCIALFICLLSGGYFEFSGISIYISNFDKYSLFLIAALDVKVLTPSTLTKAVKTLKKLIFYIFGWQNRDTKDIGPSQVLHDLKKNVVYYLKL